MKTKIIKAYNYDTIKESLKQTNNFCPCVPSYAWTEDTKCVCTEFRNQDHEGDCHCSRYTKVFVEED